MKRKIRKNQWIITSLAVLIAVAGYLNFSDMDFGKTEQEASADGNSILDEIEFDLSEDGVQSEEMDGMDTEETPGEAILTSSTNFAARAKLSREQVRSQNKADLQEIIQNDTLGEDAKQDAVRTMVEMTEVSEREAAAELLLEAKGFENVIVNLTGETADVIVPDAYLEDAKRAQIEDIVKRKTGIVETNIVITSLADSAAETEEAGDVTFWEDTGTYPEESMEFSDDYYEDE